MPCVCFGENMNEQQEPITPAELDELLGPDDKELAVLVAEMMEQTEVESKAKARKNEAKARIIVKMDECGMMGVTIAGRKLGFTTNTYIGIHREDPDLRDEFKKWMELYAPTINLPPTTAVKKALEIWQDDHPGEEPPAFIKIEERRTLFNRKA